MEKTILLVVQILLAILLIVVILLQGKGVGLSGPFGGGFFGGYSTRRGVEKVMFYLTIILSILFFLSLVALLLVK